MLRGLLRSIELNRGDLMVQTIVVDNASTDGSCDSLSTEFPDVLLEQNSKNLSFARGNNQAARLASAPLFLLLNNDTLIHPGSLQTLVRFIEDHPQVVAVGPQLIGKDGKPQRSGRGLPTFAALLNSIQFLKWTGLFRKAYRRYRSDSFDPEKSGPVGQLAAAALLIRREIFEQSGGFDEGFPFGVEDVDLCRRLSHYGSIYYLSEARIEHLGRVSSRANRGFVYRNYECGWARYLRKHHGMAISLLYKLLVTLDMPVRLIIFSIQWILQTLTGRSEKAHRTLGLLKAAGHFTLTGLVGFWTS